MGLSTRLISREELAQNDGKNGNKVYIAYKGVVYDASGSWAWDEGAHFQEHDAGKDLTAELELAPHGDEEILGLPVAGELAD